MPIVAEMLRSATGRPVALDAHPKLAIAVGAALAGTSSIAQPAAAPTAPPAAPAWQAPARVPAPPAEVVRAPGGGRRKGLVIGAVGGGIGIAAVVVALSLGGGSDGSPTGDGSVVSVQPSVSAATPAPTTTPTASVVESAAQVVDTSVAAPPGRGVAAIVSAVSIGPAPISDIRAITVDPQGAVYIVGADAAVLRVGNGESTVIGTANAALGVPGGIAVTADGTVLLSTPTGIQSIVGGGAPTVLLDAATAGLGATPGPIALDGVGNLYLADNDTHRIIRRGTDGSLSLIAGSGAAATPGPIAGDGQPAGSVPIGTITGLAVDPAGNLLFADSTTLAIRRVVANGTLSTLAGGGAAPVAAADGTWIADGTAANTVAFLALDGLAVDASSRVYVTDSVSGAIVRINADGTVQLVIARQVGLDAVDGVAARESAVTAVGAVSADRAGTLYFEDGSSLRSLPGA
jgi:sugar lactone lactonase YvrE